MTAPRSTSTSVFFPPEPHASPVPVKARTARSTESCLPPRCGGWAATASPAACRTRTVLQQAQRERISSAAGAPRFFPRSVPVTSTGEGMKSGRGRQGLRSFLPQASRDEPADPGARNPKPRSRFPPGGLLPALPEAALAAGVTGPAGAGAAAVAVPLWTWRRR